MPEKKDIHRLQLEDREIILVGTAHISQQSVDAVKECIRSEKPDRICLELDKKRYDSLKNKRNWESLNLVQVIKKKQLATLLFSLILASYQKRLSRQTGVEPGSEMLEADKLAKEMDIPTSLCDRDARTTLKRAWAATSIFKKAALLGNLFASLFDRTKVDEETLSQLRESDSLTEMMNELGKSLPQVKRVLIDERDQYLAAKILQAPGKKVIAVIGAGHVAGIKKHISENTSINVEELDLIPKSRITHLLLGWSIPAIIIGAIAATAHLHGLESAKDNLIFWFLANGIFCSLGAVIALSHPLTILAAFVAAPFTSLTPVIGAGYVTALVQVILSPPSVKEIQSVGHDAPHLKMWWKNRVFKVFLAFILPGLGSMVGTWVGAYEILTGLF